MVNKKSNTQFLLLRLNSRNWFFFFFFNVLISFGKPLLATKSAFYQLNRLM